MRARMFAVTAWMVFAVTAALAQDPPSVSLEEFKRILQNTQESLSTPTKGHSAVDPNLVPNVWTIREGNGEFRLSTAWLRDGLMKMETQPAEAEKIRASLLVKLKALQAECESAVSKTSIRAERNRLDAILARREFGKVHGPTLWDKIKQRINEFLFNLLARLFGSEAAPEIGRIFIWLVILAALGVLGMWAWRLFSRPADVPTISTRAASLPPKDWRAWLAEARRAADAGQWRDAIRFAYWAGVHALEERGVWRSDRARTPREYLRQLDKTSPYRTSLSSLTTVFERTWYAGDPADAAAYERASKELEALECR